MTRDRFSKWPLSKLPKSSETCFQSHYGPSQSSVTAYYALTRFVTFCWVHPVLLLPARFLIRTVTNVANFLIVLKSGTAVTAITASQVCPSRRPALPYVHPVFSTVAWDVAAGNATQRIFEGPSVLYIHQKQLSPIYPGSSKFCCVALRKIQLPYMFAVNCATQGNKVHIHLAQPQKTQIHFFDQIKTFTYFDY